MVDWRYKAACRGDGMDPELWFPVGTTGPAYVQAVRAKLVCAGCPVIAQCQAWAGDQADLSGVWGGRSEIDRRFVRREQRALTAPEPEPQVVETCRSGHPWDEENTRRSKAGNRECRTCNRLRQAQRRIRQRAEKSAA